MTRPKNNFKYGAVNVAVWENQREGELPQWGFTIDKRYKDKQGQWQSGKSFFLDEMPKLILALNKAYEYGLTFKPDGSDEKEHAARQQ